MKVLDHFRELMQPPERDPAVVFLARCYGLSRQGLYQLCKRHKIPTATFESPSCIFIILTESGAKSPLRTRLADPDERLRIQKLILKFYEDINIQRILNLRKASRDSSGAVGAA